MSLYVDFVDDIADFMGLNGLGTVGTDIFVSSQMDDPDNQIVLINTGGVPSAEVVQADGKALRDVTFQALVRNKDYAAGITVLSKVRILLHRQINLTLVNHRALNILAASDGGQIGQDEEGRYEFSINFSAKIHST